MKRIRVISLAVIAALSLTVTSFAAEKSPQQSAAAYLSEAGIMTGTPHSFRKSHIISIDALSEDSSLYEEALAA